MAKISRVCCRFSTMTLPWSFSWSFCFLSHLLASETHSAHAAPDFSLYLHSILKNHTAQACEGDMLIISCPSRTSVAILSAFYGRRVPNKHLCPSASQNITAEDDTECSSSLAVEKVVSECQDEQSCHIPVLSPVFGQDPCPLTSKYLLVSYKCRPVASYWHNKEVQKSGCVCGEPAAPDCSRSISNMFESFKVNLVVCEVYPPSCNTHVTNSQ